ncbi:putative transcriptional regulator [Streptomyces sp. NBRC 110611]|uniref:helix-turn-helix domain-containing protein n=1 Tax=Streptomyces sp. NBRC 110611 TaxID=1621259 RepID=UPI000832EF27|nr:helix-turn-helix transcriptional regulator [Streptomyces sp. NBRC 110611]GAU66837.1 putative transcriptional regulator [Streptomyces sp. NBRC 110611]
MDETSSPEILNPLQRFGSDVKRVRLGRKLTQKHLGKAAGYTDSYVSLVEAGKQMPSTKFAMGCDLAFGTNGLFAGLLTRIEEGDHPSWFVHYLEREKAAARIHDYSVHSIMGILQTEAYAHAIFRAGHPQARADVIQGKVDARLRRRAVMTQENPPALWVVLHEACLRTVVGGPAVMAGQLQHLVDSVEDPNVDIQVITYAAGAAAAHVMPFTLLSFDSAATVLYADGPQGGKLYDKEAIVAEAVRHFERLRAHALPPDDSLALLKDLHKEFTS